MKTQTRTQKLAAVVEVALDLVVPLLAALGSGLATYLVFFAR
jgi:hypothetical protein